MSQFPKDMTIRGRKVRVDANGLVCLNDIHKAGGFSVNQTPAQWSRLPSTVKLKAYTLEQTMGKSHGKEKIRVSSIFYSKGGADGGTWAHPNLALAYAKFLSPGLHYEVNDVFLRFKAGDATLADETLQRASPEANEWAGVRAMSRAKRNEFTQTLSEHEVRLPQEFARVTNATYQGLTGKTAAQLKTEKGLSKKDNLRDAMPTQELVFVMAAEQLAKERIVDENSLGVSQCSIAAQRSAMNLRRAIEMDRADRSPAKG